MVGQRRVEMAIAAEDKGVAELVPGSSPYDHIINAVVRAARSVYARLGPGRIEQAYQKMLADGLTELGLDVAVEPAIPLVVDGRRYRWLYPDLVVDGSLVVECKAVDGWLRDADLAQVLTYLAVCQLPVGMLINFGLPRLEYRRTLAPRRPEQWIRRVAPYLRQRRW